uniref:hypothetical protein n=1 Tax=Acetatifactor sp. TaxID=1872090 RepID=UPI004056681F
MKKKLLVMVTTCALAFAMCGCGSSEDAASAIGNSDVATASQESDIATEEITENTDAATESESATTEEAVADSTGTFTFDVPAGFVESQENFYTSEDTTHGSNFNYLTQPNDGSFDQVNAELLLQATESQMESMYEVDVTFTLLDETFYEIDGNRAFKYSMEYELSGVKVVQIQCIVEDPETLHFVTYTEINNEGYLDAFNASVDSLRFE